MTHSNEYNEYMDRQATRNMWLSQHHAIRGGFTGLLGSGAILAANNTEFVAHHTELIQNLGFVAAGLCTVEIARSSIFKEREARLRQRIYDNMEQQTPEV